MPGYRTATGVHYYEPDYVEIVKALDPIAYWPMGERWNATAYDATGNGFNGAITGATLGAPGIGDGLTSMFFDGTNDFVDVFSAGLAAAFNSTEGSIAIWCKMFNAGVWTDGGQRRAFTLQQDANNRVYTSKPANDQYELTHAGTGTFRQRVQNTSTVAWFHWAMTWSIGGGSVEYYFNGAPLAAQGAPVAWAGAMAYALIGGDLGAHRFYGWLAHAAIWAGTVLTPAQIADLAVIP